MQLTPEELLPLVHSFGLVTVKERTFNECRELRASDTLKAAIAETGLRFYPAPAQVFKLLTSQEGVKAIASADGTMFHCEKNGKPVELTSLLEDFAVTHDHLVDGRTLRRLVEAKPERVLAREDLSTFADKAAYIEAHGLKRFEDLPVRRTERVEVDKMTADDWGRLSAREKAAIIEKFGSDIVSKIVRRKK